MFQDKEFSHEYEGKDGWVLLYSNLGAIYAKGLLSQQSLSYIECMDL